MSNPIDRKALFTSAFNEANTELQQEYQAASTEAAKGGNLLSGVVDAVNAAGYGLAKGAYETADTVAGLFGKPEPTYAEKDPFRRIVEADSAELDRRSAVNSISGDIGQFAFGLIGTSKIKLAKEAGAGLKFGFEVVRGAIIGATVFDPQEERLSNLIESYPELSNPVTEYLAADLSDSDAEGRFKNALEGIGLDLALAGVFGAAVKLVKALRSGDEAAVKSAEDGLRAAQEAQTAAPAQTVEVDPSVVQAKPEGTVPDPDAPRIAEDGTIEITIKGGDQSTAGTTDTIQAGEPPKGGPKPTAAPPPDTERVTQLMEGWKADQKAIEQHGSREAAETNGHVFGGEGSLPWNKLADGGDEGLRTFSEQIATTFKEELDTAKGGAVLTDKRVEALAAQRAALYGEDPATVIGMIRSAGQNANALVANMEAGFLVANKAMQDTYKLATQIRMGNFAEYGGDALRAEEALRSRLRLAVQALGDSRAMVAASGRAVRRMRGEFRIKPEQLEQLVGMDIERVVGMLYESQGNPKTLARMATPGFLDRAIRGTGSIMANNLLWGWPTHAVNIATSVLQAAVRPAEKIIGSYGVKGGSDMRAAALKEYYYMVSSFGDAWEAALSAWKSGDSVMAPHQTEWFTAAGGAAEAGAKTPFVPMHTVGDLLKNALVAADTALRLPTRALGTIDEFIKQTSYRGYVQARAAVEAQKLGLKGADYKAYIETALNDSFDTAGRAVNKDALYEAQVRTFTQPLQARGNMGWMTAGAYLQNGVSQIPALRAIFPFVRTPVNVFRQAVKYTPGLNIVQKEYREMIQGKHGAELQAQAMGQMTTGAIALTVAGSLASSGKITGGGPSNPDLRKALEATGWKPYSIIWEQPDGSHAYVPYNRFDPVGLLFGMAADVTELVHTYPEKGEREGDILAVAILLAVAKNMGDKTYLQNINQFMRAASDPDANGAKYLGQLLEANIPFSSMLRQVNPDPYMREARSYIDHALDRVPGFSATLPPQRDPFGDPIKVRTGLIFQDNADDIVDAEQQRMILEVGVGITPPASYNRNGIDLRDLRIPVEGGETTAWDRLSDISRQPTGFGMTMKEALAKEIASERYGMAPDGTADTRGTKAFLLRQIVSKYREAAFKQLLREYPKEVGDPLARRDLAAREAWRAAKEGGGVTKDQMSQLSEFAAGYGVQLNQ